MTIEISTTKPSRLQRWLKARKTLGWYAAEVLVIFLGITFSYLFDEWRGERKERSAEAKLLRQFQTELSVKLEEIKGDAGDEGIHALIVTLDSLTQLLNKRQVKQLELSYDAYVNLNRQAFYIRAYFFNTTTPAFTAAAAGNLWPIMPDSVSQSLQKITQNLIITGNRYTRITGSAGRFLMPPCRNWLRIICREPVRLFGLCRPPVVIW
jgi:hypothetical protein